MRLIPPEELPIKGIRTSDAQRRRLESEGKFPKRVRVTARSHAYLETEIDEFVASRVKARDALPVVA